MESFSKIVNVVFHPIVIILIGVFLLAYRDTNNIVTATYWTFLSLVFSGIISTFVYIGVKKKFFNNLDVSNRRQRIILYPFAIVVVLLFAFFVHTQHGPIELIIASIFFVIALLILDIVNRKIKASIHVSAVASLVTGVILVNWGISFFLILFVPLVAWARITQRRHTLKETIVGAICGICLTVGSIYIVQFVIR